MFLPGKPFEPPRAGMTASTRGAWAVGHGAVLGRRRSPVARARHAERPGLVAEAHGRDALGQRGGRAAGEALLAGAVGLQVERGAGLRAHDDVAVEVGSKTCSHHLAVGRSCGRTTAPHDVPLDRCRAGSARRRRAWPVGSRSRAGRCTSKPGRRATAASPPGRPRCRAARRPGRSRPSRSGGPKQHRGVVDLVDEVAQHPALVGAGRSRTRGSHGRGASRAATTGSRRAPTPRPLDAVRRGRAGDGRPRVRAAARPPTRPRDGGGSCRRRPSRPLGATGFSTRTASAPASSASDGVGHVTRGVGGDDDEVGGRQGGRSGRVVEQPGAGPRVHRSSVAPGPPRSRTGQSDTSRARPDGSTRACRCPIEPEPRTTTLALTTRSPGPPSP